MEKANAGKTGTATEHGRRDASDTSITRTAHRRSASSPGETTRDEEDDALQGKDEAQGVVYDHEPHPSHRKSETTG